jgi:predicted transcriptional regulator
MPNEYTEEELEYMRENYGSKTNDEIARELGRTKESIRSKAYRMGMSKNEETVVSRRIDVGDYNDYVKNRATRDKDYSNFVSGIIVGEASFIYEENKNKFSFSIGMTGKDKETVQFIRDHLDVGSVYQWNSDIDSEEEVFELKIGSEQELIEEIIPYVQENLNRDSAKWQKFIEWRDKLLEKHGFSFEKS